MSTALVAVLLVAWVLEDPAGGEALAGRARQRLAESLPQLTELAAWCQRNQLAGQRDRVYELILEADPDCAPAREALKYRRAQDGSWTRSASYRAPRNESLRALEQEYPRRRDEILEPLLDGFLALVEEYQESADSAARHQTLALLLLLDQDCAAVRDYLGETREGGRWLLSETVAARAGRKRLLARAQEIEAEIPEPEVSRIRDSETELRLPWKGARATAGFRVAGTVDDAELLRAARALEAAAALFRDVFVTLGRPPRDFTFYLLRDKDEARALLERHASVTPEVRAQALELSGCWICDKTFVKYSDRREVRIDGVVHALVADLVSQTVGHTDQGWGREAVAHHFTELLLGTRLTTTFGEERYASKRGSGRDVDLRLPDADWLLLGRKLYARSHPPDLPSLMGRDLNDLTGEDTVLAYAVMAYFIWADPRAGLTLQMLQAGGEHPVEAIREATGFEFRHFTARLGRWLEEMGA